MKSHFRQTKGFMPMITEYLVCYGSDIKELQEAVNKAIQNGWQPFGGVGVALSVKWLSGQYGVVQEDRLELLCQAVVK
jgi:hypothetical protein